MQIIPFSDAQSAELWDSKFNFFWYNSPQVFEWTQADFDRQAKMFHDNGVTVAMTFSSFHFRANFIPWREQILKTLEQVCRACHKYHIKVYEHHSCSLIYDLTDSQHLDAFKHYFKVHHSTYEQFPGIIDYVAQGLPFKGVKLADCFQIDGRTGKPVVSHYHGQAFCYNNPTYQKLYLEYVDDMKNAGIDGLLADDVQYFGDGHACTCEHCRRLFKEQTGYELPDPEHWNEFFGHVEKKEYIAWLKFKVQSTAHFQDLLTEHYRKIGLDPYRANYRSDLIGCDSTANTFTCSRNYWAQVFQENCWSEIIRYCWPHFYCESLLQYAVARQKNSASMSLFYPDRFDQYYLSWALSVSWGQLPFLCPEGANLTAEDQFFSKFEQPLSRLFRAPQKQADLAFLMSRESLDFASWVDAVEDTYFPMHGAMQGAYFANLIADAVLEDEPLENFCQQKCLVAAGITRVSAELAKKLLAYVQQGGRLLILGKFATYDTPNEAAAILSSPNTTYLQKKLKPSFSQQNVWLSRMYVTADSVPAPPDNFAALQQEYGELFKRHLPAPPQLDAVPDGYLAQVYKLTRQAGKILHLLHIDGMLVPGGTPIAHTDSLDNFTRNAAKNAAPLKIVLNCTGIQSAQLYTPEQEQSIPVAVRVQENQTELTIPAHSFAGYAGIELMEKC